MELLPTEMKGEIESHLDVPDLLSLLLVNKQFHQGILKRWQQRIERHKQSRKAGVYYVNVEILEEDNYQESVRTYNYNPILSSWVKRLEKENRQLISKLKRGDLVYINSSVVENPEFFRVFFDGTKLIDKIERFPLIFNNVPRQFAFPGFPIRYFSDIGKYDKHHRYFWTDYLPKAEIVANINQRTEDRFISSMLVNDISYTVIIEKDNFYERFFKNASLVDLFLEAVENTQENFDSHENTITYMTKYVPLDCKEFDPYFTIIVEISYSGVINYDGS